MRERARLESAAARPILAAGGDGPTSGAAIQVGPFGAAFGPSLLEHEPTLPRTGAVIRVDYLAFVEMKAIAIEVVGLQAPAGLGAVAETAEVPGAAIEPVTGLEVAGGNDARPASIFPRCPGQEPVSPNGR